MAVNNISVDPADESGETRDASVICVQEDLDADQEYEKLNAALDEISNCLDVLENKNDSLQEKLKELLKSNQQLDSESEMSESPMQES